MTDEARVEETENGKVAVSDGWFALHVSEIPWLTSERFGSGCRFEGKVPFRQVGVNLRVLEPGSPACLYHRENAQEDFFVISGECLLVVEGQERRLRGGTFVHCPPNTDHVFVGAGDGPCVILMMGHRPEKDEIVYPVSEAAARYGASAERECTDPQEAYGDRKIRPMKAIWPLYGVE